MKIPKQVYYAHSIALYNTAQEARDIQTLEALGFSVLNPNSPEGDAGYKAEGMDFFNKLIANCDALAFRANPGGSINAGVHKEIVCMMALDRPVFELPTWVDRQTLTVEHTRQLLRELGHR